MALKGKQIKSEQNAQYQYSWPEPDTLLDQLTVSSLLPESADVGGGSARVTADEVSRPHGSSEISALRQVRSLISRGKDAAVAAGRGSSPGAVPGFVSEESERPLGVNSLDGAQADSVAPQNVLNLNLVLRDADLWRVEGYQGKVAKEQGGWQAHNRHGNPSAQQGNHPAEKQDTNCCGSQHSGESRTEDLHVTTLTRSKEVWVG